MRTIAPGQVRSKLRTISAIDACFFGWIGQVTRRDAAREIGWVDDGPVLLDEVLGKRETIVTIRKPDVVAALEYGKRAAKDPAITRLEGSHGFPRAAYQSRSGMHYELWELVRFTLARLTREPLIALNGALFREEAPFRKGGLVDELFTRAICHIEAWEDFFKRARFLNTPRGRKPPVFLEGGLDLVPRILAIVARSFGHPVIALENCWIPGYCLVADETGAAVNRWNLLDPALNSADPVDTDSIRTAVELGRLADRNSRSFATEYEPPPFPENPETPVVLVLGQVPWDASIVDQDALNCWLPDALGCLIGSMAGRDMQVRYRPHPEERAPSSFNLTTSWTRFQDLSERGLMRNPRSPKPELELVQSRGNTLEEELFELATRDRVAVVTVNSQAGWQAARWVPTYACGPSWYARSGLVMGQGDFAIALAQGLEMRAWFERLPRESLWGAFTAQLVGRYLFEKGPLLWKRLREICDG